MKNTMKIEIQPVIELAPMQFFILNEIFSEWTYNQELDNKIDSFDYITAFPEIDYNKEDFEEESRKAEIKYIASLYLYKVSFSLYKGNKDIILDTFSSSYSVHSELVKSFYKELQVYKVKSKETPLKVVSLKEFKKLFELTNLTLEYNSYLG